LIFMREYPLVVRLQDILLKNVRRYYKELLDQDDDKASRQDLKEMVCQVLKNSTKFDSYNQINFEDSPDQIFQMMKGFLYCGSYATINIGYPSSDNLVAISSQTKFLTGIAEEFKESLIKYDCEMTILEFFSTFKVYNDYAFELIELDTPVCWFIDVEGRGKLNVFEQCLDGANIQLAMKLVNSLDISKVISSFPIRSKNLETLLNSESILEFLEFISQNEEKMKKLILDQEENSIPYERFRSMHQRFEGENEGEDDDYTGIESPLNVMYMHNFRNKLLPKIGKEIPYFNLLFFSDVGSRYILDELVKKLKLVEIKKLNSLGYQIGKLVSVIFTPKSDMIKI